MNDRNTGHTSAADKDKTAWDRLDRMADEDIDCSEIPELDTDFWENAQVVKPGERHVGRPARSAHPRFQFHIQPELKKWLIEEAGRQGFATTGAYLTHLIVQERDQRRRRHAHKEDGEDSQTGATRRTTS